MREINFNPYERKVLNMFEELPFNRVVCLDSIKNPAARPLFVETVQKLLDFGCIRNDRFCILIDEKWQTFAKVNKCLCG